MRTVNLLPLVLLALVMSIDGKGNAGVRTSLDGMWLFAIDPEGAFDESDVRLRAEWRSAVVPLSWQAQFPDLRDYQGVAWYRREFSGHGPGPDSVVLLCFEAVDYTAEIFVNGQSVGAHEGGYTPFCFDVSSAIVEGLNEVLVRVMDPILQDGGTDGITYATIPHGKQSWYVQTSGLWQSVYVAVLPRERIRGVRLSPSLDGRVVCSVEIAMSRELPRDRTLVVEILGPSGRSEVLLSRQVSSAEEAVRVELIVPQPRRWSWRDPQLYTARVALDAGHEMTERFGFRQIEARDGKLYLNGEPFFMIGALDQDFYPSTMYSVPSVDTLRQAFESAKRLGLNTLRCHIKIPDRRYLDLADELGLMVWYEVPNWDLFTPEVGRRASQTLDAMLDRDWNHPSLVVISLINESWGLDLKDPQQRAWLQGEFRRAKVRAAGRLVVDNSACWGNFHLETDINDYHTYWAIPENKSRFDATIDEVATRPNWLFSPFGDGRETGQEPLVLSEFGTWGLPDLPRPHPWWVERPFFDQRAVHPLGFETRFRDGGLAKIFGSFAGLVRASQQAQSDALKYQIETIRARQSFSGYVITEFTDINWECNGLLDMWRREKVCAEILPLVQQDRVVVARPDRYNWWSGESARIKLLFSNFGASLPDGGVVHWASSSGGSGSFPLPPSPAASVLELEPLMLGMPEVHTIERLTLNVSISSAGGQPIAQNALTLIVYPRPKAHAAQRVHLLHDKPDERVGRLHQSGSHLPGELEEFPVMLCDVLDDEVLSYLVDGGSALCLVGPKTVLPDGFPLTVIRRDSGMYDGNWASNLNWVRSSLSPFEDLPSAPRLGFETAELEMPLALGGVPREHWDDVLSGFFVGWIHNTAAYVVQMKVGAGTLLLCTLPLAGEPDRSPFGATMLSRLLRYCAGPESQPEFSWDPH